MKTRRKQLNDSSFYLSGGLLMITLLSDLVLSSTLVSANDSATDKVRVTVPVSCTISGTGMGSHNATINSGTYNSAIGETTMKAFCNDHDGFAIYAVGYTDDEPGKNVLSNASLGSTHDIATGTNLSGNTSSWAMKLTATPSTYTPIIAGSSTDTEKESGDPDYSSFQAVPNRYAKVAYKASNTDVGADAEGSTFTTTYQAYISSTQPAGTYSGKVKYTLVHPNNHTAPVTNPAVLDTGKTVNSKLRSLAATVINGRDTTIVPDYEDGGDFYEESNLYIKSINVHLETPAPADFIPSEKNTISTPTSKNPIYIIFDNTNDAGIMHFYTKGERIVLSPDSSYLFHYLFRLSGLSDISSWDTSNVTNMSNMFVETGQYGFTTDLSSWDTSSVTNMSKMFLYSGRNASTWSIGDLSSWDTSKVINMSNMFSNAGSSASTFTLDLSSWNTSNVTDMSSMFSDAGHDASTWSIGDLSSWDTSKVISMANMFKSAGSSFSAWFIGDISSWDTSNVTNISGMFEGAAYHATTFSLNLSSWDTSSVTDMSIMFQGAGRSASTWSVDGLSSWNTSNVTDMSGMFHSAGYSASIFYLDLSSWNTSNVTRMNGMFLYAGENATIWSIKGISSWNTSKVTNMFRMFSDAGPSASTFTLDLSSWDTSNVTNMTQMFYNAGSSATTFNLNLSSWNTSNVTSMDSMFEKTGSSATTWSVIIPPTNGNNINNNANRLYGEATSIYAEPSDGKSFTLAQP